MVQQGSQAIRSTAALPCSGMEPLPSAFPFPSQGVPLSFPSGSRVERVCLLAV
jgi:hypothetical protein